MLSRRLGCLPTHSPQTHHPQWSGSGRDPHLARECRCSSWPSVLVLAGCAPTNHSVQPLSPLARRGCRAGSAHRAMGTRNPRPPPDFLSVKWCEVCRAQDTGLAIPAKPKEERGYGGPDLGPEAEPPFWCPPFVPYPATEGIIPRWIFHPGPGRELGRPVWGAKGRGRRAERCALASVVGTWCSLSCLFSISPASLPLPCLPCFCPGFGRGQCQHMVLTVGSALGLHVCPARQSWSLSHQHASLPGFSVSLSPSPRIPLGDRASLLVFRCPGIRPAWFWGTAFILGKPGVFSMSHGRGRRGAESRRV